ncbi:MAG: LutC/YkgG family protein [Hyphomicrobium sp.]
MSIRAAILARVRRANARTPAEDAARRAAVEQRLASPLRHLAPAVVQAPDADLRTIFSDELRRRSASVIDVERATALPAAVAACLDSLGLAPQLRIGGDLAGLQATAWRAAGLTVLSGRSEATDAIGLSEALAGVAETGTLVVGSGPDNPVTVAFLPETHLVVVAANVIVATLEDAIDRMRARYGRHRLPRSLNLISAPSRTGDIEGRIVLGAHGPRRLAVFVYGGD